MWKKSREYWTKPKRELKNKMYVFKQRNISGKIPLVKHIVYGFQEINELLSGALSEEDEDAVEAELSALIDKENVLDKLPDIPSEVPVAGECFVVDENINYLEINLLFYFRRRKAKRKER